jgi:hypothetical protein
VLKHEREEEMAFFSCTVNEIGPAADGTETPDPVIYVNLTDTGGSFVNQWFYAGEKSKAQMLSVGLAAMSTNRQVEVAVDTPNVPYSSITRMYLLGSGATKLAFNQSFIGMPTSGKSLDPIDIGAFAKIRFAVTVNGSGSIQFFLSSGTGDQFPSGYALDDFQVSAGGGTLTRTYDVAGLTLLIQMIPSDSDNQAIIGVFGN